MIEVSQLNFTYSRTKKQAVNNMSFDIRKGEVFGFLGPSGAGKTTTQRLIIGLLRNYTGHIRVFGRERSTWSKEFFEQIGVAFDFPNLYIKLTAGENLKLIGAYYKKVPENLDALLDRVGLLPDKNMRVENFSKGMKMRLNFIRAIMHNPELMRIIHAVIADIRFQVKQGFYYVYAAITIMYLVILSFLPENTLDVAVPVVIFSDPSVLGLFFIGGIIMLEKLQGVLMVVVVTPLRTGEYILSKLISLAFISLLVGFAIAMLSRHGQVNWIILFLSIVLTSAFLSIPYCFAAYYLLRIHDIPFISLAYIILLLAMVSAITGLLLFCGADDKVKGLTFAKGLNMLNLFAFADLFSMPWLTVLSWFFPAYWITAIIKNPDSPVANISALAVHLAWLGILILRYRRRSQQG